MKAFTTHQSKISTFTSPICIASLVFLLLALTGCGGSSSEDINEVTPPSNNSDTLLYSSNPNGHNELSRLQDDVSQVLLSNPAYDYWWPKVSPDKSSFIVYRSPANANKNHDNYENADLMLFDMDGNNPRTLISRGDYGWVGQGVSRWNKDGSKILMATQQTVGTSSQWRMVITDAQGNNPKNLSEWWIIDPNFSPDNQSIVFIAFPNNALSFDLTQLELHQADYNASNDSISNIMRLTYNTTRDHDPSYSPDGSKTVFSAGNAMYSDVDIVTYDVATATETILVNDSAANGGSMDWSNDGKRLYFHSLDLTAHPFRIKQFDTSSLNVKTLLETTTNDYSFYHPEVY